MISPEYLRVYVYFRRGNFIVVVLNFVKNLTCAGGLRVISRLAPAPEQSSTQYTPAPYSSQNTTFLRNPSTGWIKPVPAWLTNHNLCDMFYTLIEMFVYNLMLPFHKIWDITEK